MTVDPQTPRPRWPRRVAAALLVLLIGIFLGGHSGWMPGWFKDGFAPENTQIAQVKQVLGQLDSNYYRPVDNQRLVNIGLQSIVSALNDPYSHYYPATQQQQFNQETNPQVSGIGVDVSPAPRGLSVDEVFPGAPAARAGLQQGDVITRVGSRSLTGMNWMAASALIKGRSGTKVTLQFERNGHLRTVTIVRRLVVLPQTASKLVRYRGIPLGYLAFNQFTEGSAKQLRKQVQAMLKAGARGLILDLRANPGGLVDQAVAVASLFIRDGTIVSTRGRNMPTTVYHALGDAIAPKIPLVVLVDRGTASSAEIVTAALQQRGRAKVVGTRTYGKGVFQESETLPWGGILDITVGQFYTPNGHNLGGSGVIAGRSVTRGPGIKPNIYVADNPTNPGLRALRVAERVLAGELSR